MATMTELSPTARKSEYSQDIQGDEKLISRKVPSLCSIRYGIALIAHFCSLTLMAQNTIINITMVVMVNSTDHQSQLNRSAEGLSADLFDDPDKAPKNPPARGVGYGGQLAVWQRWAPPHERSSLCSIALSGMILGAFLVTLMGGLISQALGWPFVFYIFGGIGCVCCLLWCVVVYDDPGSHPWISTSEKEYIISSLDQQVSSEKQSLPIKAMLSSLPLWSICLCSFSHQWLINTFLMYTPTYISFVFKVNIRDNGLLSSLPFLVSWVIGILTGKVADFLLVKNFRLVTVRKVVTILGTLPPSVLLAALPYLNSSYVTTITFLTISCGLCPLPQAGVYINALDIAPRYSDVLLGASRGFAPIAAVLVPTVSGFLLNQDPEFGWKNIFFLLFAINILGLIFYLIFGKADVQDWAKERKLTRL
uniref:Sodium-dependent phosphate transport protein 4 isoform X2 n=1 Tax=Castor canadensis TaxID=51338 RepID=A0A8B7WJA5_CASCN|nr:sodium-dependent phosphate transport protein 4 isoform X2 [Castor canadensis]